MTNSEDKASAKELKRKAKALLRFFTKKIKHQASFVALTEDASSFARGQAVLYDLAATQATSYVVPKSRSRCYFNRVASEPCIAAEIHILSQRTEKIQKPTQFFP